VAQGKQPRYGRCQVSHGHVIKANAGVVIHTSHGQVYGCAVRSGRRQRLVDLRGCEPETCDIPAAAVAGKVAVVAADWYGRDGAINVLLGYDFGRHRWVLARENGAFSPDDWVWCPSNRSPPTGAGRTFRLIVAPTGAAAWIARRDCSDPNQPPLYEVHTTNGSESPLVASGRDIDPRSLALAGRRFYWLQGGTAQTSALGSPPADIYEPTEFGL
jgi:hypothetical protein